MTTTTQAKDVAYEAWKQAEDRARTAAEYLAYDVTFRADDPRSGKHAPASPELTTKLKAAYVEAHAIELEAFKEWQRTTNY